VTSKETTKVKICLLCEEAFSITAADLQLPRILHQAGVRSVVASLWKVHDRATRAL
jgi:CHAT domain-containing protein